MNANGDGGLPPSHCVPAASAAVPSRLAADRLVSPWLAWEDLESLDLLLWLGSASRAAEALRSTSATVSRRAERCSQFLGLALQRDQSGWHLSGSSACLERERDLQQRYRLAGFGRLRLDLACFSAGLLPDAASTDWLPSRWSVGSSADLVGHRSLELLGARVTDALLVAAEGCEGLRSSSVVPCRRDSLAQLPLLLVGHRDQVSAWMRGERGQDCLLPPGMAAQTLARSLHGLGLKPQLLEGMRADTYGGKLVENATQAVARDVLAWAMPETEAAGYEIIGTVHDEVICETPSGRSRDDADELSALLAAPPPWAEGLPLAAAGFEAERYRK